MKPERQFPPVRFECSGLVKSYPGRAAGRKRTTVNVLDGLDIEIPENSITALFGPSGSGKSTLSRILLKLEPFDRGRVTYRGTELDRVNTREFRAKNQILFQNPYLSVNPTFNVKRILADPLRVARLPRTEIKKKIDHTLDLLEMPKTLLKRLPRELSGGQLQRVALGRTLILEPDFVVLDEPFSSLDEIMATRLIRDFKNIFRRTGVGVLYISHHIRRVRFLSDFLAHIRKGKIVFQGSKEAFFSDFQMV